MVVCMAAPISPRSRRNKEKPANALEPHSKIRRRRVTRTESQESHQTKKIPKELALEMGHGLADGEQQEVTLEERIKAIVIGNQKEIPRHFLDQDMRGLCSTAEIEEWIRKSFTNKNSVKGSDSTHEDLEPERPTGTKGANLKKKEHSEPKISYSEREPKISYSEREPKISYSERRTPQTTENLADNGHYSERLREQQIYSRSQPSVIKKGGTQNSICKRDSRQTSTQSSSHHPKAIAQTNADSSDRKSADAVRCPSSNRNDNGLVKRKSSKENSREDLVNTNITDSEKILYKLRSTSIVRHKSLHNPPYNSVMLLPDPRSDRGRSDDTLQRSVRSRSESRTLEKGSDSRGNSNFNSEKGGCDVSSKQKPETAADEKTDLDKPEKPNSPGSSKIVRKKSTLSRNKTDLFRAAKEHPSSISRLKEKFAKFSAVAYQRKISNQLSMSRKKKNRASESLEGGPAENAVSQGAKELQSSCRIVECSNDSKPNSQTPSEKKPSHSHTPRTHHKPSAKDFQQSDSADVNHNHSRTPLKGAEDTERKTSQASSRTSQSSSDSGGTGALVLRQCLIGANLAFGLVQLKTGPNGNSHSDGHGLVTIRMRPDEEGRFGFNVKGGADQGMPIIVSRVAPGTPADIAIPRLNEGDQVLFINGRDVSQHTHEQVVMFIRASRETHSGELVLIVRPNVYVGDEGPPEEPNLEYLPENYQIIAPQGAGTNALEASLMLLQESLDSGAALAQFEQLYRKKPGMTMNAARLDINIAKNRYRDISPYDQTRVILKEQNVSGGDYINANYVNMEIPGSGIVNRYIAAQGPLPKTCTDFWQMVWEQHSSLVVMLTTKVEKGRVKCHQYWPEMYETMDYGLLQITCVKEEETPSFAFREFNLTHVETSEERHISHMQYIAWPDHNVPDDPADFLEFVLKVRQRRMGMVEPTVVHCSAGIGRTGVLITMETAMCLVEANQPVYPLSIVRQMRDQRAMLIQTATQYKFVCEAILKVYNEELVKPLEDYQR